MDTVPFQVLWKEHCPVFSKLSYWSVLPERLDCAHLLWQVLSVTQIMGTASLTFEGEKDIHSCWTQIELRREGHKECCIRVFLWGKLVFWASLYMHVAALLRETLEDLVALNNSVSQGWQLHKWRQDTTASDVSLPTISYHPLWGDYIIQGKLSVCRARCRLLENHEKEAPLCLMRTKKGFFSISSSLVFSNCDTSHIYFFLSRQLSI